MIKKAISEIHRVLKPGGHAFITVPTYGPKTAEDKSLTPAEREQQYGLALHCRMYSLDFADKLKHFFMLLKQSRLMT
jgi:hypothetical protein